MPTSNQEVEDLLNEYDRVTKDGAGLSLDPDGYTQEQKDAYVKAFEKFFSQHGEFLLRELTQYVGGNRFRIMTPDLQRRQEIYRNLKHYQENRNLNL